MTHLPINRLRATERMTMDNTARPLSTPHQSQVFLESEGNGWFERNRSALRNAPSHFETDTIKRVLQGHEKGIETILEIGCSNGTKLSDLATHFGATGCGIDPSSAAIEDGKRQHPDLNLSVATASSLPYGDNHFDLVYFGFCLYLVDRRDIMKAVAEADRVLKSGGFLSILDFDPTQRHQRPYHHKPGLFSYKTDHSAFFTGTGHYYLVAKDSFSHGANHFSIDSNERVSVSILFKEPDPYGASA